MLLIILSWCAFITLDTLGAVQAATFRIYDRSADDYIETPIDEPMSLYPYIDKSLNTTIIIAGFNNSPDAEEVVAMISTCISLGHNVIQLAWEEESKGILPNDVLPLGFAPAILIGKRIATITGESIVKLIRHGVLAASIRIIGHSLGAHMAGWTAEKIQEYSYNISSICGLDPAGPAFGTTIGFKGLSPTQASLVYAVHTNSGQLGTNDAVGAIDFWVNCDLDGQQPGCPKKSGGLLQLFNKDDTCSHIRALWLMSEALKNPKSFPAASAKSCRHWKSQKSSNVVVNYLGDNIDPSKRGNFYFSTYAKSPYSKGQNGIKCN